MTAVASPDRAKPAGKRTGARLPRLAMLAVRDLRGNLRSFWVFLSCLALGVAAITGVGTLADAVRSGLDTQGRVLLGGDIAVARVHVRANEAERRWLDSKGKVSEIAMLRAMARKPGGVALGASALAEIKAVDAAYPLTGTLTTADGQNASALLRDGASAIVDRLLAERLGIGIGDRLMLGDGEVVIKDYVGQEPDKLASQAAYGPRVLISLDTLARTGLAKPGSLTRWVYRILAPDGEQLGASGFEAFRAALRLKLPEAGFSVTDRRDPAPGARRAVRPARPVPDARRPDDPPDWRRGRCQCGYDLPRQEAQDDRGVSGARGFEARHSGDLSNRDPAAGRARHRARAVDRHGAADCRERLARHLAALPARHSDQPGNSSSGGGLRSSGGVAVRLLAARADRAGERGAAVSRRDQRRPGPPPLALRGGHAGRAGARGRHRAHHR